MTFDYLFKFCLGRLKWTEQEFRNSTLRAILLAIEGYYEESRERQLEAWKRSRMVSFFGAQPYSTGKLKEPKDLFLLDGEESEVKQLNLSNKELEDWFRKCDEQMKLKDNAR